MSGICGVLVLDGERVEQQTIDAMTRALEKPGPDGSITWLEGPLALGHALLATSREGLVNRLPLTHAETGCVITANARIDRLDELQAKLGLSVRQPSDAEAILLAYLKWGENCLDHLEGDFAFAIWDPRKARLFCARDQVGMRPFHYYHAPGHMFCFASDASAILRGVSRQWGFNRARFLDYLGDLEPAELEETFFEGIHRLPPAHKCIVEPGRFEVSRYWSMPLLDPLRLTDGEYVEVFTELFERSIRSRLRSGKPVAAMLSGGLDSSSICGVAGRLASQPLTTISGVGPDPDACLETRMAREAATMEGLQPHFIDYSQLDEMQPRLAALEADEEDPFDHSMAIIRAIHGKASELGCKVVLDGAGSDILFNERNWIARLMRAGRVPAVLHELRSASALNGAPERLRPELFREMRKAFIPHALRSGYHQLRARMGRLDPQVEYLAHKTVFARQDIEQRVERIRRNYDTLSMSFMAERAKAVFHPDLVVGRERYNRVASAFGIEPRDPFLDLDLIRFCLRLPGDQLRRNGVPKHLLREAMRGILPEEVRIRTRREHLGWQFSRAVNEPLLSKARDSLGANRQALLGYVSRKHLEAVQDRLARNQFDLDVHELVALSRFLTTFGDFQGGKP